MTVRAARAATRGADGQSTIVADGHNKVFVAHTLLMASLVDLVMPDSTKMPSEPAAGINLAVLDSGDGSTVKASRRGRPAVHDKFPEMIDIILELLDQGDEHGHSTAEAKRRTSTSNLGVTVQKVQ